MILFNFYSQFSTTGCFKLGRFGAKLWCNVIQGDLLDCYLSFRPSSLTEVKRSYPYEDFSGVTRLLARISLTWKYEWGTPWFSFRVFRTIFKIFKRMNMVRTMWSRFTTVGCWPVTDWPNVTWHQIVLRICVLYDVRRNLGRENSYHNFFDQLRLRTSSFRFFISTTSGISGELNLVKRISWKGPAVHHRLHHRYSRRYAGWD